MSQSLYHEWGLQHHVKLHKGEQDYVCEICGKTYVAKQQYKIHLEKHKEPPGKKCGKCDQRFATMKELIHHKKIHDNENLDYKYICAVCGASFVNKPGLTGHMFYIHNKGASTRYKCKTLWKNHQIQRRITQTLHSKPYK